MHELMERLHRDHHNLNRLFDMLEDQVARYDRDSELEPDLMLILDIVTYLNDYPKVYHHPLEEQAIALMAERQLGDERTNQYIHDQHHHLEEGTEQLNQLFTTVANDQPVPIETIRDALDAYLTASRKHLESEDSLLFPVMEQVQGNAEWREIAARLPERRDPLFAEDPDEAFAELKSRL